MDNKPSTPDQDQKEMRKQFLLSLIAIVVLTFVNVSFPFFNLAVILIWPIPIVNLAIHQGMRRATILVAISALINGLLFNPVMGLLTVAGFGFVGFVMAGAILEKLSAFKVLIMTVLTAIISNFIILAGISFSYEGGILATIQSTVADNLIPLLENGEMTAILEAQLDLISLVIPGMLIISGILTGILNYYLVHWFFDIKKISVKTYNSISYWRFPALILSLGLVIAILLRNNPVGLNLLVIVIFLLFLQGFGVGLYYVRKKTKSFFLNWIYILIVIMIPVIPPLLFLIGLVDLWFDIRKLKYGNN
ncbi:MAG: DUF2232 domain-containing protein [Bacillota bacterium]